MRRGMHGQGTVESIENSRRGRARSERDAELLDGVVARHELVRDNAQRSEHRQTAIVELAVEGLLVEDAQAQRILEVAGLSPPVCWLCPPVLFIPRCHAPS
eukprot:TRINITY_DN10889_c0_g2_i10.p3 TRINITY_DN10889_c0_g2~~TRINITY_DN10889_c0_g2_i10.p3  ORF type:complete len:101 (-),score=5.73 TRINITY_DN10889_c0_g2_i10:127-429(-)